MYTEAAKYRADRKAKAEKMAAGSPGKPDSSDWSQAGPLDANVQTGERPISRRQFKSGGTVSGDLAQIRADRAPRSGGWAKEYVNRDVKAANEDRAGTKHVGGFAGGGNVGDTVPTSRLAFADGESKLARAAGLKSGGKVDASVSGTPIAGGRTPRATGGETAGGKRYGVYQSTYINPKHAAGSPPKMLGEYNDKGKAEALANHGNSRGRVSNRVVDRGYMDGGSPIARKSGGRTKGKMNVNIIIGAPGGGAAPASPMPVAPPPQMAGPVHPPMPAPGPVGPPPGVGAPPPMPMARKRGGRTYDAGAGGGEGRLEKVAQYGKNA